MGKLSELINLCKCEVSINVNQHVNDYMTVMEKIENIKQNLDMADASDELTPEIEAGMILTENIVEIHAYNMTPVGQYSIFHFDIEAAMDIIIESIKLGA